MADVAEVAAARRPSICFFSMSFDGVGGFNTVDSVNGFDTIYGFDTVDGIFFSAYWRISAFLGLFLSPWLPEISPKTLQIRPKKAISAPPSDCQNTPCIIDGFDTDGFDTVDGFDIIDGFDTFDDVDS